MAQKVDYGIDAPGVIRNFYVIAAALLLLAFFTPRALHIGQVVFLLHSAYAWTAAWMILAGTLMLLYARVGKFRHRDRMLNLYPWTGREQVLDVGMGRGLLLAGAAKRLTKGHATGIDIWNAEDLSGNAETRTRENLHLEGVAEKCTLLSEGAQQMSFPDDSFDVILSNLCLHNIYDKPTRVQACREIARVLKPAGTVILSDYKLTGEYARVLRECGLEVNRRAANWLTTFPPLHIVIGRKPLQSASYAEVGEKEKTRSALASADEERVTGG
jgi:arsenite methyltransferase